MAPAKGLSLVNVSYAVPVFPREKAVSTAFDELLESLSRDFVDIREEINENEPVVTGTRAK